MRWFIFLSKWLLCNWPFPCDWICHQLDDWVLCRIYKKKHTVKALEQKEEYPRVQINLAAPNNDGEKEMIMNLPRTCSLTYLLDMSYFGPISQLLSDGSYNTTFDFQSGTDTIGIDPFVKPQLVEMTNHYAEDSGKYQVKQGSTINQPVFVKQVHDLQGYD